jgi:CheY-like chemotaxis protein
MDRPRILIAEDGRAQRAEVVELLERLAFTEVFEAQTAHEAIKIAMQSRPEVVILDGLLPGMHGFEVARFIRNADPAYRPHIIFVTAIYKNVRYQNEAKLLYGIDAYVIKPVTEDALRFALAECVAVAA